MVKTWYGLFNGCITLIIIHQIFSLARDWSKQVTCPRLVYTKTVDSVDGGR